MHFHSRAILTFVFILSVTYPQLGLSQMAPGANPLPWQQPSPAVSPSFPPTSQHHRNSATKPSQAPGANSGSALRDSDDRKLNSLATEYYRISIKTKHPVETLKKLQKRVKEYESAIKSRTYLGMDDLIHDSKNLEQRIDAKIKKITDEEAASNHSSAQIPPSPVLSTR